MNSPVHEPALIEVPAPSRIRRDEPADNPIAVQHPTPMGMLDVAVRRGASLEEMKQLLELQERWEAGEARKAFNLAFSQFKAEAITVLKQKKVDQGPLAGKSYAELYSVVNAVTPALSRNGLGASWKLTKDEKDWIEVTCTLMHSLGHSQSVSMGGPPDTGGAKSPIQARASTISYLERYTLKAICGVAEQGDDTDGNGKKETAGLSESVRVDFENAIDALIDEDSGKTLWPKIAKACFEAKDKEANDALKQRLVDKVATFKGGA